MTDDVPLIPCSRCGHPRTGAASPCPHSGSFDQTVETTSALLRLEIPPGISTVTESTDPTTGDLTIRRQTGAGGSSENRLSADRFRASVSKPVEIGRAGEPRARDALRAALVASGRNVLPVAGADDGRGEDDLLQVDGQGYDVQIETVPAEEAFWQGVQTQPSATTDVPLPHAVNWVHKALCKKFDKTPAAQRAATILALDVTHFGALSAPAVVSAFHDAYPGLCAEQGWDSVWLLGPTQSTCTHLGK